MADQSPLVERAEIDAVVQGKTIVDFLNRNADDHPNQSALHWKNGEWDAMTWADYRTAIHEAAAGLQALGVGGDEFVALMAGNRPEHVIADYAVVHAGATPVTIYSTLTAPQIQYIADNCKATVAILENLEFMKRWEEIRAELPNLRYVVLMSGAENYEALDWVLGWDDLLGKGKERLAEDPGDRDPLGGGDYSGHAGDAHLHEWHYGNAQRRDDHPAKRGFGQSNVSVAQRISPWARGMVSYLPLAHIAERLSTHYLITYLAGEVWYCPNLAGVLEYIQKAQPTIFFGVPRVFEKFHARLSARFAAATGIQKTLLDQALAVNAKRVDAELAGKKGPMLAGILDKIVLSKVRGRSRHGPCRYSHHSSGANQP